MAQLPPDRTRSQRIPASGGVLIAAPDSVR
jgi:hypothetical protein